MRLKIRPLLWLLAWSVFAAADATCGSLVIIFGPEQLTHSTGRPTAVTRSVHAEGYEGPFTLHLRNGDAAGRNRVSAARVSLNDQILLDTHHFSQKIAGYDIPVALSGTVVLTVWMASAPGGTLTVWIDGMASGTSVGPRGGTLSFPNGVVLRIPPGALDEETVIDVGGLSCVEVDALIDEQDRGFASHRKRCIGGFSGRPDGLLFALPIEATFPVTPLMPGEWPLHVHVDPARGVYWPTGMELLYDGQAGVVTTSLRHFSETAAAGVIPASADRAEAACRECDLWSAESCAAVDPLLYPGLHDACCTVPAGLRQSCSNPVISGCHCCKERLIEVHSESAEFEKWSGSDACALVMETTTVQFLGCTGQPKMTDTLAGTSVGCPKNMTFKIDVDAPGDLMSCEEKRLTATLRGTSVDGTVVVTGKDFGGIWESLDTTRAQFADPRSGVIQGLEPGPVTVRVTTVDGQYPKEVSVTIVERKAGILPESAELHSCNNPSVDLSLSVDGLCGGGSGAPQCSARWVADNPRVIEMSGSTANAVGSGGTTVRATLDSSSKPAWCPVEFSASETLKATGPSSIEDRSELPDLLFPYFRYPLKAVVLGPSGAELACEQVYWDVEDWGVARLSPPPSNLLTLEKGGSTRLIAASWRSPWIDVSLPFTVNPMCAPEPDGTPTCSIELNLYGRHPQHRGWIGTGETWHLAPPVSYLPKNEFTYRELKWEFTGPGEGVVVWEEDVPGGWVNITGSRRGDLTLKVSDAKQPSVSDEAPLRVVRMETYRGQALLTSAEVMGDCFYQKTADVYVDVTFFECGWLKVAGSYTLVGTPLKDGASCPRYDSSIKFERSLGPGPSLETVDGTFTGALGDGVIVGTLDVAPVGRGEVTLQRTLVGYDPLGAYPLCPY